MIMIKLLFVSSGYEKHEEEGAADSAEDGGEGSNTQGVSCSTQDGGTSWSGQSRG